MVNDGISTYDIFVQHSKCIIGL